MNQPQVMNQVKPQMLSHNQQAQQPQMKTSQIMMNHSQPQPPMMNRGYNKVWSQQPPLDPNMKFQNPMKPNYRSNWKGKKVTDKRKDPRRKKKPVEFTPIPVSYDDLLPYPLDYSMIAMTPTKVPQPPFL